MVSRVFGEEGTDSIIRGSEVVLKADYLNVTGFGPSLSYTNLGFCFVKSLVKSSYVNYSVSVCQCNRHVDTVKDTKNVFVLVRSASLNSTGFCVAYL